MSAAPVQPAARIDAPDEPPFDLRRPAQATSPVVFASPHSGRLYPADMMAAARLGPEAIRRSEDAYVDALFAGAPEHGAPLLLARYARAYVDLNRAPYDLDPGMFEDELPPHAHAACDRAPAGLGSIARIVAEGQEIYRRKLTFAEAQARIGGVHAPYHAQLEALLDEAHARFGAALLVDCHSMPAAAALDSGAPDVVLGDCFGRACAPALVHALERRLRRAGLSVTRNRPYAGGYTTQTYGRPALGRHAVQVEINRSLYLDERTLKPHAGLSRLTRALAGVVAAVAEEDWRLLN